MADKYKNKYRIPSARASFWDYGRAASYFVTICTKNRKHFFGWIEHKKMILSEIGEIVNAEWLKTFDMRPDMNLSMGEYVVMPNHFHAIIAIGANRYNTPRLIGRPDGDDGDCSCRDAMHCVSTADPTTDDDNAYMDTDSNKNRDVGPVNRFGPQYKNLSSIIRGFKISVTTNGRKIKPAFGWQALFNDHIIRDSGEYQRISNYIKNNPANWKGDRFNS